MSKRKSMLDFFFKQIASVKFSSLNIDWTKLNEYKI